MGGSTELLLLPGEVGWGGAKLRKIWRQVLNGLPACLREELEKAWPLTYLYLRQHSSQNSGVAAGVVLGE